MRPRYCSNSIAPNRIRTKILNSIVKVSEYSEASIVVIFPSKRIGVPQDDALTYPPTQTLRLIYPLGPDRPLHNSVMDSVF